MASTATGGNTAKFDVCIDALMNGCVNAFTQLYTLSHRPPLCVDELAQTMFSVPDETLPWVLERLTAAEMKRRHSDYRGVLYEHTELAAYFEKHGDKEQAISQLSQALQACVDSLDHELEGEAHEAIALLFERLGVLVEATTHHETRLKLAEISSKPEVRQRAAKNLIRVFNARGNALLAEQKHLEAKAFFEKAVACAKNCGDTAAEAKAYASLGSVTVLIGDLNKALEYNQRFLLVSREAKDGHGEAAAALEVAKLQGSLGHSADAINSLKDALAIAEAANDLDGINSACRQLADTYKADGNNVSAVHYFREHFKVSRDIGDARAIENARISLGFAMGDHHFTHAGNRRGFLNLVVEDLPALLEWMGTGAM